MSDKADAYLHEVRVEHASLRRQRQRKIRGRDMDYDQPTRIKARIENYDGIPCMCNQCTERRLGINWRRIYLIGFALIAAGIGLFKIVGCLLSSVCT